MTPGEVFFAAVIIAAVVGVLAGFLFLNVLPRLRHRRPLRARDLDQRFFGDEDESIGWFQRAYDRLMAGHPRLRRVVTFILIALAIAAYVFSHVDPEP